MGAIKIKAIIRWEQLRGKCFSLMDYRDREDVEALLYTTRLDDVGVGIYTFDVFRKTLVNERLVKDMVERLEMETCVLAQFQKKGVSADSDTAACAPTRSVGDIVSMLVMNGLDASYALNEMELCDIALYIEAFEKKRKEEMESCRLWTYLSMLPHIDGRKMKNGARDLIAFPWEEAEAQKEAEQSISDNAIRFEELMKMKKGDFYGK